jgi:hypothetical protein
MGEYVGTEYEPRLGQLIAADVTKHLVIHPLALAILPLGPSTQFIHIKPRKSAHPPAQSLLPCKATSPLNPISIPIHIPATMKFSTLLLGALSLATSTFAAPAPVAEKRDLGVRPHFPLSIYQLSLLSRPARPSAPSSPSGTAKTATTPLPPSTSETSKPARPLAPSSLFGTAKTGTTQLSARSAV